MSVEKKTTVLLADKPNAVEALRPLVGEEYRLLTAVDCSAAGVILDTDEVDVLVVDQHVPGGTGLELIQHTRQKQPEVICLLFAKDDPDLKVASVPLQQGVVQRILSKPCRPSDFKAALRTAAEVHRLRAERRDLRRKLEKAGGLRMAFLSLLARELRTPTTYLRGVLELMKARPDPEQWASRLDQFDQRLARLSDTIERVLELEDADNTAALTRLKPVPLTELLRSCVNGLEPLAQSRRQSITATVPDDLPTIAGHRPTLQEAFSQLLLTALLVSKSGAEILLTAAVGPSVAEVAVTDAGEVIPEADRPVVFEPFYFSRTPRLPPAGSPERWIGLHPGLAAVKRYLALHGGRIELRDTSPAGSTFVVSLPIKS